MRMGREGEERKRNQDGRGRKKSWKEMEQESAHLYIKLLALKIHIKTRY